MRSPEASGGHVTRPTWALRTSFAFAVACALALGGCGIAAQQAPQAIERADVPYGLLGRGPHPPASLPRYGVVRVTLWLEGSGGQLDPVPSYVPWPLTVGALLNALSQGPDERQSDQGLVSPASAVGPLTSGRPSQGVVPVYLPQSFENLGGNDQLIAVAQVVFTLTQLPGVRGVVFWLAGQRARVPDAAGKLIAGPLTRADYQALTR